MARNFLADIDEKMPEFSKSQRYLANYIKEHYEKAAFMTAARLGAAVNISESTVVRFAIEMGFEGYPEMQKELQNYSRSRLTTLQRLDIANNHFEGENLLKNVMTQDIDRIKTTLENIDEESFNKAVDRLFAAKKIYIFGAMSSDVLARFLDNYLQLAFGNVVNVRPINSSGILQQLFRIDSEDVLIAISFPRYSKNAMLAADFAKKTGANIIAITDSISSPLAEYADELLLARSDMASYADSLVAPMSLINALIAAVGKRSETLGDTLRRLETLWDENDAYKKVDG